MGRRVPKSRPEGETDSENFSKEFSAGTSVVMMDKDCNERDIGQGLWKGVHG